MIFESFLQIEFCTFHPSFIHILMLSGVSLVLVKGLMSTIKLKPRGRKYFSGERQYVQTVAIIGGTHHS